MAGGDLQGLVSDPAFRGLPPQQQRAALAGVSGDDSFGKLSDAETMQFVSRMSPQMMDASAIVNRLQPAQQAGNILGMTQQQMDAQRPQASMDAANQFAKSGALMLGGGIQKIQPAAAAPMATPAPAEPQNVSVGKLPKETPDPYSYRNTPKMESADSTNISKAGFHDKSNTMVVEFKNGRVYEYKNVPRPIYQQFQDAESQGSFFARNIKGRYQTAYRGSVVGKN